MYIFTAEDTKIAVLSKNQRNDKIPAHRRDRLPYSQIDEKDLSQYLAYPIYFEFGGVLIIEPGVVFRLTKGNVYIQGYGKQLEKWTLRVGSETKHAYQKLQESGVDLNVPYKVID